MKRFLALFLSAAMILMACGPVMAQNTDRAPPASNHSTDDIPVIIDVLIMRPVGLAACIVGLAAAIIALPFALPSDSTDKVYQALIVDPFNYTFKRPIGSSRPVP
jgi:hypothetical protein